MTAAIAIILLAAVYRLTGVEAAEGYFDLVRAAGEHIVAVLIIAVILFAAGVFGIGAVNEDSVTRYSLIHPGGVSYDFGEIDSVDTGFNRKGNFYYIINVDGHTIKFSAPTTNVKKYPDYEAVDYREFVDIDAKLMSAGVQKNADTDSIGKAQYDESCMESFREVIE